MAAIIVNNLQKNFKTKVKESGFKSSIKSLLAPHYVNIEAVKNISFQVEKGEILAFIGPNGAGKSTTIKMLTGILYPSTGFINVLGLNPNIDRKKLAYKIGNVFGQKSQLWFHLPPMDSLKLLGAIYDIPDKELLKRIDYLVEMFDINDLMEIPVRKLSLGQRIRCEIAASLLHKPQIIFLDEPTIGLDIIAKQKIRDLILQLNKDEKTTIFLTSHDVGDIEQLCSRVIIINHGTVVLNDSIENIKSNYLNKKIIDVKYNEKVSLSLPGFDKITGYDAKINVNLNEHCLHDVMTLLMNAGNVADIAINSQPLEEIIASIYSKSYGGAYAEV